MTQRCCRMHRRGWTRVPGTARAPGSPPHTERTGVPPTPGGAAAHTVDGNIGEPGPPTPTSRRATPPSTMWTAAGAISAAQIGTRASDDRNQTRSEIRILPKSLATTIREPVPSTLLALLAMGKSKCRYGRTALNLSHVSLPRPPPALLNPTRTE